MIMRNRNDERVLREYISRIIKEEESYGSLAVAGIGASPYGSGEGDAGKKIFLQPFIDVWNIGIGKLKELKADVKATLKTSWRVALTSVIPTMNKGYKDILDERDQEIAAVKSQYKEVYNSAWSVFKNDDFALLGFFYNPTAVLTSAFAKKASETTLEVMDTLVAGSPVEGVIDWFKKKWEKAGTEAPTDSSKSSSSSSSGGSKELMKKDEGRRRSSALLREDKSGSLGLSLTKVPPEEYEKLVSKVMQSPKAKQMMSDAKKLVNEMLTDIYKKAQDITNAKSFDDLKRLKLLPNDFKPPETKNPEEQKKNEALLFNTVRESMKKNFKMKLEDNIKSALKAGIPESSEFIAAHKKVINAISSL